MPITIRPIAAQETIDLRHRVMWPDLPRDDVILPEDADGVHFGAFRDAALVGVGSFFRKNTAVRLRKLAVDEAAQGQGIARQLLHAAFNHFRAEGCDTIWCDARTSATAFYCRCGFQLSPVVFQKRGKNYVVATREL